MPPWYLYWARIFTCLIMVCANTPLFASPLNSFVQQVWDNNPAIQAAQSALEAAKARKSAADQPIYNPEVDVELERTDINTMSIGISQSVDWGNKRSAFSAKADADIQLAQAELAIQRFAVAKEILIALVSLQTTGKLQNLARQRVELMQGFVDNTETRRQAGDIGIQDVMLARVALSEAKMQLANYASQQVENEATLHAACGIFVTDWPALKQEPPSVPESVKLVGYLDLLPSLSVFKAKLSSAKSNIAISTAERKADPSFGLRAGMEDNNALVGINFSMPFNVRNKYRAEVEVAHQEARQIEQLLLSTKHRANAHLNGSYRRYQITYAAWQSWKQTGISSLNEQLELIQTIWQSGEMSTSDYLVQAKQNVDARETAVELSARMWDAWIEWLDSSGQIEHWLTQSN